MATSERSGRGRALRLRPVSTVDPNATVRHVDQLDEETLTAFYRATETGRLLLTAETELEHDEVIVFTDYYRVERV